MKWERIHSDHLYEFILFSSTVIPHKLVLAFPLDLDLSKSRGTGKIPLLSLNSMWTQMCCSSHRSEAFDLSYVKNRGKDSGIWNKNIKYHHW